MELSNLGKKIREKRKEKGYSLKGLADLIGKTPSFLSQIERNLAEPSITTLREIAKVLNVPMFFFLYDHQKNSMVVRKGERKSLKLPDSRIAYQLLTPDLNKKLEMIETTLEPGASSAQKPLEHTGEECTLVLEGKMEIIIGEQRYVLEEGDSIYNYGHIPHKITNIGDKELRIISAITPPYF